MATAVLEKYMSRGFVIGIPNADFFRVRKHLILTSRKDYLKIKKVDKSQPGEGGY